MELQHLEQETDEGRRLLGGRGCACDVGECNGTVAKSGFAESETGFSPVIRLRDPVAQRLLDQQCWVGAADQWAAVAAVVQHALRVGLVRGCHCDDRRGERLLQGKIGNVTGRERCFSGPSSCGSVSRPNAVESPFLLVIICEYCITSTLV